MAFLTSYRAEKIYFEKLRSNIDIAKSYIQRGATDEVMALLQNAVDADGAIMLCYRNLGEVWADLAAQLEKTQKALEDLKTALEEYHDDLNKKIDEINNYLVRLINALDERVTILENESKVKFAYLLYDSVEDVYSIEYNGETADFDALSAALEYPHLLVLIDNENGNIYYPRSVSDVLIDFHADGVSGDDYVDISVTMTDSDVVTFTEKTVVNYTFGTGFNVSNTHEVTPDLSVLQAKLSAGFGIEIDSSNEISVDTNDVQEKLIAGQNITLTPDATDPTKTVIGTTGANYTPGFGIDIDTNNAIKNTYPGVFPSYDSTGYALSSAQVMPLSANASYTSEQTGRKLYKATISTPTIQVPTQSKKIVGLTMNINSPATTENASDTTQNDRETQWYGHFDIFATLTFAKTGVSNKSIEEYFGSVVFLGMVNDSDAVRVEGITSNLYNNIEGYANKGFRLSSISVALRGYVTVIGTNDGTGYLNHTRIINFLNTRFTTRPQLLLSDN